MEPIYALFPINVGGIHYIAGEEITCGSGARASLLRLGQATVMKPGQSEPDEPDPDDETEDEDIDEDDDSSNQETESGESTPLSVLGLEDSISKKLQDNGIGSIEQLDEYLADGSHLQELTGIGAPTEAKILEAREKLNQPTE